MGISEIIIDTQITEKQANNEVCLSTHKEPLKERSRT